VDAIAPYERKLVAVLFADLTNSTGLAERLDPEQLQDVMDAYANAVRLAIEAEGGTLEKFIGDAVVAFFGVPAAHEDDAARALRAALKVQWSLEELNDWLAEVHGLTLQAHMGVHIGSVIAATDPRPGDRMVTGVAVNIAQRL
jgi:class 3 adenylate cyclase